jgi:hypothetical protein
MAIKNSFVNVPRNRLTRNFGGTVAGVADPYVTGYHFIYFGKLPSALPQYAQLPDIATIQNLLAGACLSVTPPGGTLNKIEFTGLGGVKWAVPGNIDYGNSVSVKFLEFNGTPILNIFHGWIKMMRDYRTGATAGDTLNDGDQLTGYTKATYAGIMYYWTTAPDAKTVEYYAAYDGVFPTKDPQDLFTSDVETVGRLDTEIEFNCDYIWHEDWVKAKCQSLADNVYALKTSIIEEYGNTVDSAT